MSVQGQGGGGAAFGSLFNPFAGIVSLFKDKRTPKQAAREAHLQDAVKAANLARKKLGKDERQLALQNAKLRSQVARQ